MEVFKSFGGKLGKGIAVELYLDYFNDQIVAELAKALQGLRPEDIPELVHSRKALPIRPDSFRKMKGFEGYLATIKPERIFGWLSEARPDLAMA